jgi:ribose-phosphate pyrophosphokinase
MDIHNTKGSGNAAEQLRMGYRNLDATRHQIEYARRKFDGNSLVVIGPDTNALERTRRFARALGTSEGVFDKERSKDPNELTERTFYIGACLRGKRALSADDMADSLGTIKKVEGYCRTEGAVSLDLVATHAILSHPAIPRLTEMHQQGIFGSLAMTNTVTHERGEDVLEHYRLPANVETIEVQAAFAEMVYRTHNDFSTNPLLTDRR